MDSSVFPRGYASHSWTFSTSQLAAELCLSESYFSRVFRDTAGQSPASYMERARMDLACRLLVQSPASITDIAHDLGYKTSQHFATVFKEVYRSDT
ncbi:helix-turn-helix transcriptional regulator [Paenibacillus sp. NPDC093718]|uniref:helix-turn-helix transcriptional regulator n=1 Tax=Paenibacillus sp. NPDC093718 TaxID=3390601 RepID=UPI003D01EE60